MPDARSSEFIYLFVYQSFNIKMLKFPLAATVEIMSQKTKSCHKKRKPDFAIGLSHCKFHIDVRFMNNS